MSNQAYYCLHKFKMIPSEYLALSRKDRAFIAAAIDIKAEQEKRQLKKAKRR